VISRRDFHTGLGAFTALGTLSIKPAMAGVSDQAKPVFNMPDEAAPHARTFMQWPVNRAVYPDHVFLGMVQNAIARIANAIAPFEPVVMLMADQYAKAARRKLSASIDIWDIPTDDLWCRDSGPVFVKDSAGNFAISHLNFNGWGNKQTHHNDGKIARRLARRLGLTVLDNGLVGEAGGVEADGAGTLIAHESSWINPNRNIGSKAEIGALLLQTLGARKLIWAPGIKGADITDYHIDALARFVRPGHVLIQMPEKVYKNDPWSKAAFETYEILKSATDAKGRALQLTVLGDPKTPRIDSDDFVASYVNYYVCNGAVIAAQFGDRPADAKARETLARLYPAREIIMLNIDPLGEIGGGIHCATMQQPAV